MTVPAVTIPAVPATTNTRATLPAAVPAVTLPVEDAACPVTSASSGTAVHTLVALGDSTPVGLGDPLPGGGWRGFPALLGAALGATQLVNPARPGARMGCVRREQLPVALTAIGASGPAAAVLFAGMNDTLRSDFDPAALYADCAATVSALRASGAHVLVIRYHDHTRVFRLPAPLRRALCRRIADLNDVVDAVAATDPAGVGLLDLHTMPGGYDRSAWAVDRLHPSELGHRLLAAAFAELLAGAGFAVPYPVSLECGGGREVTAVHRAAWLVAKGVPWLVRRSSDLGPVIVQGLVDGLRRTPDAVPNANRVAALALRSGADGGRRSGSEVQAWERLGGALG